MKKFWKNLEFNFDYYICYFLYNEKKLHLYHKWMKEQWDNKYLKR